MVKASSGFKISEADIEKVSKYIESYWPKLIRENKEDLKSLIGLPNPYIVPANIKGIFQEQYYWDSYPIVRALIDHPKYSKIAIGMVENFFYMIDRFGIIPNASRLYFLSRSQPPLLSSMVLAVYDKTRDDKWLKRAIDYVEYEYWNVWMGRTHLSNFRHTETGLNRYYDVNAIDVLAEAESGWDMTARFMGRCLDFLPVDLNCLLYLYEQDLGLFYKIIGDEKMRAKYKILEQKRAALINQYMWDAKTGYFYDYDFVNKKRSHLITVAGVYPLNVGIANQEQVNGVVAVIKKTLQKNYGVVQSVNFVDNKQWDYPNGWPPMQLRTIEALMRYGYNSLARRLITKWLLVNIKLFSETGYMWEKYDVVNGRVGVPDRYPTPHGFAWTNAVFLILVKVLKSLEGQKDNAMPVFMTRRAGWY